MNAQHPTLRVFLDEGVSVEIAKTFMAHGHEAVPFKEVLKEGSPDTMVCMAALANDAILVAFDRDMKRKARHFGVESERFKRLNLIRFDCPAPMAHKRLEEAMTLIEHEWNVSASKTARRLHVEIGTHVIRTFR